MSLTSYQLLHPAGIRNHSLLHNPPCMKSCVAYIMEKIPFACIYKKMCMQIVGVAGFEPATSKLKA